MIGKAMRIVVCAGMGVVALTTCQLGRLGPAGAGEAADGTIVEPPERAEPKPAKPGAGAHTRTWTFDDVKIGAVPADWTVAATTQSGPLPTWKVIADQTAPSGGQVLAMARANHTSRGTYNLCWTKAVTFLDGEIEVRLKARTGRVDQGGGVIWRAIDKDNYYISRWNPLEDNFRIYYVQGGRRTQLATAAARLSAGEWHTLRIVHKGNRIAGYLNGKKLLELTAEHFSKPGGVGLWTKADAVTSFDDFTVTQK